MTFPCQQPVKCAACELLRISEFTRMSFVFQSTLDLIDKSFKDSLDGVPDARELRCRTLRFLRTDKEENMRSISE